MRRADLETPRGGLSLRCVALIVSGAFLVGCYLSHRPLPPREVEPDWPTPLDAGLDADRGAGLDAGADAGQGDAGFPPDYDVCEAMCTGMEAAGCPVDGCHESCDARRRVALEIDCSAEFKGATACLLADPCSREVETSCGEEHGWVECLRRR